MASTRGVARQEGLARSEEFVDKQAMEHVANVGIPVREEESEVGEDDLSI